MVKAVKDNSHYPTTQLYLYGIHLRRYILSALSIPFCCPMHIKNLLCLFPRTNNRGLNGPLCHSLCSFACTIEWVTYFVPLLETLTEPPLTQSVCLLAPLNGPLGHLLCLFAHTFEWATRLLTMFICLHLWMGNLITCFVCLLAPIDDLLLHLLCLFACTSEWATRSLTLFVCSHLWMDH